MVFRVPPPSFPSPLPGPMAAQARCNLAGAPTSGEGLGTICSAAALRWRPRDLKRRAAPLAAALRAAREAWAPKWSQVSGARQRGWDWEMGWNGSPGLSRPVWSVRLPHPGGSSRPGRNASHSPPPEPGCSPRLYLASCQRCCLSSPLLCLLSRRTAQSLPRVASRFHASQECFLDVQRTGSPTDVDGCVQEGLQGKPFPPQCTAG